MNQILTKNLWGNQIQIRNDNYSNMCRLVWSRNLQMFHIRINVILFIKSTAFQFRNIHFFPGKGLKVNLNLKKYYAGGALIFTIFFTIMYAVSSLRQQALHSILRHVTNIHTNNTIMKPAKLTQRPAEYFHDMLSHVSCTSCLESNSPDLSLSRFDFSKYFPAN